MKTLTVVAAAVLLVGCSNPPGKSDPTVNGGVEAGFLTGDCQTDRLLILQEAERHRIDHLSCDADADCTIISAGVSCQSGCLVAIASAELPRYSQEISQLETSVCGSAHLHDCNAQVSCRSVAGARCAGGKCVAYE